MVVNCDICRTDISKFFGKNPMGICESCHIKICPKCMRKTSKCPKCGNFLIKTKSIMNEVPEEWKTKPCPKCGKKLGLDARFCDGCGSAINPSTKSNIKNKVFCGLIIALLIVILFLVLEFQN